MADRPILFSAPMIRALLAGTKTQTRRLLKPQPHLMSDEGLSYIGTDGKGHSPRIAAGDHLYVREHWCVERSYDRMAPRDLDPGIRPLWFKAGYLMDTGTSKFWSDKSGADYDGSVARGKHRQAMHMPRWASRLTLTVDDVRVERLQDISREDAIAEGLELHGRFYGYPGAEWDEGSTDPREAYGALWVNINGRRSWYENPWVVTYTFTVHHGNIDQIAQVAA